MYSFFKCSNKLSIDHKIDLVQKHLEELQNMIDDSYTGDDYSREYAVVFDALINFENIRLLKLFLTKVKSSPVKN